MFPVLHKKFLIFTPSLASAFPQATSTAITPAASATRTSSPLSLPTDLQALVPDCARSCFQSILFDEWPLGCAGSGDVGCLCSQYSTTGLTLGEAAYGCAFTSCTSRTPGLASTYGICSGHDGAVAATHSTLTFTAHTTSTADTTASAASSTRISSTHSITNTTSASTSTSTSSRDSSTSSTASSSSRNSSRSTTLDTSVSTTTSAAASSTTSAAASSTTVQSSASSSATAAAAASSAGHGSGLSTAQIVGISVASVSAVVLAAGVLCLLACLRKRDRKKEEEATEKQGRNVFALTPPSHDNVAMSPSAMAQFPSPPRNRRDPRNGAGVGTGFTVPQVRLVDPSPPRQKQAPTPLENIGLAITDDSPVASPASFSSNRTVSQLLPDKPEAVHPLRKPVPVPKSPVPTSAPFIEKKKRRSQRDSTLSQGTVFEEEDSAARKPMYPVRAAAQAPPRQDAYNAPARKLPPPIRPYRAPPSFAQEYTASPAGETPTSSSRQPSLSLAIPPQGRHEFPRQPTPSPPPIPSPLRIGVARPSNVAKPPLPVYPRAAPAAAAASLDQHSSSASSGSANDLTGANSTSGDSSSYIPAYYTSPPTSIMQTPPESYGHAASGFGGPVPQPHRPFPPAVAAINPSPSSSAAGPWTRPAAWSPQRQAQTIAAPPQPPAPVPAGDQNRLPPQPGLAHPRGTNNTTGQQAPPVVAPPPQSQWQSQPQGMQGSSSAQRPSHNAPQALRQQPPPAHAQRPPVVAAAVGPTGVVPGGPVAGVDVRHQNPQLHNNQGRQQVPAHPPPTAATSAANRNGPPPWSSSSSASTRQPAAPAHAASQSSYKPYTGGAHFSPGRTPVPPPPYAHQPQNNRQPVYHHQQQQQHPAGPRQAPPPRQQTAAAASASARPPPPRRPQRSTSSASMTSFESASLPGDPSPPTEDEVDALARQLGGRHYPHPIPLPAVPSTHVPAPATMAASRTATPSPPQQQQLTPPQQQQQHGDSSASVSEERSPISDIKYPKVPRASNQAVPRCSPNASASSLTRNGSPSPRVVQQQQQQQHSAGSDGSPKGAGGATTLLARRRPDLVARDGNGLLIIDSGNSAPAPAAATSSSLPSSLWSSPQSSWKAKAKQAAKAAAKPPARSPHTPQGQIIRGEAAGAVHDPDQARKSSAALPPDDRQRQQQGQQQQGKSDWPISHSYEGGGQGDVAIKTPMWAPRLTPTRRGEDMYLAVAYASKEGEQSNK